MRLNSDGSRDLSFPGFPQTTGGDKITPWNGKYYVGTGAVRRLSATGLIDPTFIDPNMGPYFSTAAGGDYHVYPDGRLLLSGVHPLSDSARGFVGNYDLVWLTNTGYLDTTRIHKHGFGTVFQFKELPDGHFICSSTCTSFEGHAVDRVFKFDAEGLPDTTFRTGVVGGAAHGFLPMADGRVYVGGAFERYNAPNDTLRLVRFMSDGSLDPTFTMPGFSDGDLNGPFIGATLVDLYPWGPDRFIVVGYFRYVNGEPRNGICMLDSTGTLLSAFDGCGVGIYVDGSQFDNTSIDALEVDSAHNHIYICGAYNGYNDGTINDPDQRFVSRLFYDESTSAKPLPSKEGALQVYPNPVNEGATIRVVLPGRPDQKDDLRLRVFNAQGEQLFVRRAVHGENMLDLTGLSPGLYCVYLGNAHTWIEGSKFVVE